MEVLLPLKHRIQNGRTQGLTIQTWFLEVAEKKVISNNATAGIYYWQKGSDFCKIC